jgi:hypothetical protein
MSKKKMLNMQDASCSTDGGSIIISTARGMQNFIPKRIDFMDVIDLTAFINYSPIIFKDNYRCAANFLAANLCILDYDGNITLKQAKKMFAKYHAIIVTTKSHQMDSKNGKPILKQDRFRVLLRFDRTISSLDEYERIMRNITHELNSDEACTDGARFFYPNPYQVLWISTGRELVSTNKYNVTLPSKGNVTIKHAIKSDVVLAGDIEITDTNNITLLASQWTQELDDDETLSVHCPNPKHEDKHPSAFIAKAKDSESQIFLYCHSCGNMGTFPKITRKSIFKSGKGTNLCQKTS